MIDSHCHLHYDYAPKTVADLVREAHEAGVTHLVTVGVDLKTQAEVRTIAENHAAVYFTAGVHPHDAVDLEASTDGIEQIRAESRHPKCVAIGEIGLDYYYEHSDREAQKRQLARQLALALEVRKPIVVHSRDAEADLLPMLEGYAKSARAAGTSPGIIHCFTGTQAFGQACIDAGFFISLSGIVTFKNAEDLRTAVKSFDPRKLIVETDSPYLAPIPNRGKKCEPRMVVDTAKFVANLVGVPLAEFDASTTANTRAVFGI